jgi:hypothetical protein
MESVNDEGFRNYIATHRWQFAKTMAEIPHEYTVAAWYPNERALFEEAVQFIRDNGYGQKFFSKTYLYYDVDEHQYWTMGSPLPITKLINRAIKK